MVEQLGHGPQLLGEYCGFVGVFALQQGHQRALGGEDEAGGLLRVETQQGAAARQALQVGTHGVPGRAGDVGRAVGGAADQQADEFGGLLGQFFGFYVMESAHLLQVAFPAAEQLGLVACNGVDGAL